MRPRRCQAGHGMRPEHNKPGGIARAISSRDDSGMVTRDRSATPRDPLAMSCPLLWVRHTAAVLARKLLSEKAII